MELNHILDEIHAFCAEHADPQHVVKYARYFTEGYDAYGIPSEIWFQQKDALLEKYKMQLGLQGFLDLGERLLQSGKYEETSFAIYFLLPFQEEFTKETFYRSAQWLENGIRNWAHCDVMCGEYFSIFFRKNIVRLADLSSWRESLSKWQRRAVPVNLLTFLKMNADAQPLLEFIRPLMLDDERVVHQGLGWFLRETWKKQPQIVEAFLLEWKDSAARLIFQYATEKMSKEERERFRRKRT